MQSIASDVSACIPTLRRHSELADTLRVLLAADDLPATVLVSDSSGDFREREALQNLIRQLLVPDEVGVSLLPPPPVGTVTGNRNWLAEHVETPFLLFLDDDVDLHREFLADALRHLRQAPAASVVAAAEQEGQFAWFTRRGHFRPAMRADPISIPLQASLWPTSLFRSLWLDEEIVYGYEDGDLSLRLYASHAPLVRRSPYRFRHRAAHRTTGMDLERRDALAERARCYVSIKRYSGDRGAILLFLVSELAANGARGKRLLPPGLRPQQWREVVAYLLGGARPGWANLRETPRVRHLAAAGTKLSGSGVRRER